MTEAGEATRTDALSGRIAALSPAKRALLERALERQQPPDTRDGPQRAGAVSGPLSCSQQRLWFLDRLQGGSAEYHIPEALRLRGDLDVQALELAVNAIVARHESLRTRIGEVDGKPIQVVAPSLNVAVPLVDLSGLGAGAREEALDAALRREREMPFSLNRGPLLRLRLLKLGAREHVLAYTFHHIVSDGWSLSVFNRELTALYPSFRDGREPLLEPLPFQYADYARWQRRQLEGENGQRLLDYWGRKLAGAPPLLDIPTDNPRDARRAHRGESRTIRVPAALKEALSALCRREQVTLFVTLLAAFKLLLARLSGQQDVVVGTPSAGRGDVAAEQLIGFFINTLALRTDLSGNPDFLEALGRVRATTLEALEHQDLHFERLVEQLQPQRDLSHTSLFQVFFNMLSFRETPVALAGLEVESIGLPEPDAKFDLTLYAMEQDGGILLRAVYNADLFRGETIERLLQQLHHLLEQIVVNPREGIQGYSLLCTRDLKVVPDPTVSLPAREEPAIHLGFVRQARRVPHRTAVVDREGPWSYAELDAASTGLAHHLRRRGLSRGEVVAVRATASASLVCCLLGILKAGGAFVVLDSSYPEDRLRRCLEKAKPVALLNLEAAGPLAGPIEKYADGLRCRLEIPTRKALVLAALPDPGGFDAETPVAGTDPAHVIFTSGSTGQPLGVLGTHRPASHFLRWHIGTFGLTESDRFSLFSGVSHDILLRDVFTPLWLGASLHVPPPEMRETSGGLTRWLANDEITVSHVTPALAELLCQSGSGDRPDLEALRWMFFGGDRLTHGLVRRVHGLVPRCGLVNFYGTTETPQAMSFEMIDASASADRPAGEGVPIGKGIDGVQLLLLNQAGQRAGIGELAEIYVRTPHLGTSYLDEEQLTHERFLTNPFTAAAEDRVYRTGDRGRYLPDGSVAFAGRRDQQVKLRGFRIELAEVEAALRECAGVRECVVVAGADEAGETRLVAYVAPSGAPLAPDVARLREMLRSRLPGYMIPAAFVMIERLPLTPNGKVDRMALPLPASGSALAARGQEAPRTSAERLVTRIWGEVFDGREVGVHDNFFDLGGHSLLAVRFVSLLRGRAGIDLPIRLLFESPTPAELAQRLAVEPQANGAERFTIRQPNQAAVRGDLAAIGEILGRQLEYVRTWQGARSAPGSFIVTLNESGERPGLFWCLQGYRELTQLATHLDPDQPVHGMRSGHLIMEYTDENVDAVATHYAAEMIALQPDGPFLLGGNCQGGTIARAVALRLRALGRQVELLVLMEMRSFAPYDGPVALIFGRDSLHNPFVPGAEPEAVFRLSYPAGYTVDFTDGAHGEFFESPNIEVLAATLKTRLPDPPGKRHAGAPVVS